MKTLTSTPDYLARFTALGSFPGDQFSARPTFESVVAQVFKDAVLEAYPQLEADFSHTSIAEVIDLAVAEAGKPQSFRFIPPAALLIQGFVDRTTLNLSQDLHRLTIDTTPVNPTPLPVRMESIGQALNEWAPHLIESFTQALANFWSKPTAVGVSPWLWLSRVLQVGLSVMSNELDRSPPLTQPQSAGLAALSGFPDKTERLGLTQESPLHAYLVCIDTTDANGPRQFQLPGFALITRTYKSNLIVMGYSLANGIELFDSVQAFADTLPKRLKNHAVQGPISWSLYEPEGHLFQALAQTLLDNTLYRVTHIGQTAQADHWSVARLAQALDDEARMFEFFNPQEKPWFNQFMRQVPSWLSTANPADIRAYSRLMATQVAQQQLAQGKSFFDDIPALLDFAVSTLNTRFQDDHPLDKVDAAQIEIHNISIQDYQMAWITEEVMPLAEFSLSYVGGKPAAFIGVKGRNGHALPTWLTGSYIKTLLEEIDIGTLYISLLKAHLVDDAPQVARRQTLFTAQLKAQLPLLALELKLRGRAGLTEAGWKTVARLMKTPSVADDNNGHDCIRPLAFYKYDGANADTVANMYVLGPRDMTSGPFILYRPFATDSLLEYATVQALMDAIKQPGELQDLVLAWLDDSARGFYVDGGFERPHLESVLNEGFLALLPIGPTTLADLIVKDDALTYVFKNHVQTLVMLADKQTVSNSERRWILLKRYAWMLFNGLTFFVSGPLQKAAWIFQTLIALDEGLQARIDGDKDAARQTVINLLFNLGLALLSEGLNFKSAQNEQSRLKPALDEAMPPLLPVSDNKPEFSPPAESPAPAVRKKVGPDLDARAVREYSSLDFSWFSPNPRPNTAQLTELNTFTVDLDVSTGTRIEVGPLKDVINYQGKSYVVINKKTWLVSRQEDGLVIQDAKKPIRFGPWLTRDSAGQWDFDLRMRLRGGGPKKRIQLLREERKQTLAKYVEEETRLINEKLTLDRVLTLTENLMASVPARKSEFIERLESEFARWNSSARALIKVTQKMNEITPVAAFEQKLQAYWIELTLKLFKLQNALEEQRSSLTLTAFSREYKQQLNTAISELDSGNKVPYLQLIEHLKKAELLERKAFEISLQESEGLAQAGKIPFPPNSPLSELVARGEVHFFDRHWAVIYMETLLELVLKRDTSDLTAEELHAFNSLDSDIFTNMAWSQLKLRHDSDALNSQHIEFYEAVITTYQGLASICENLISLNSEHFRNQYLPSLIESTKPLRAFAERQLSKIIRESESSSSEPDEPRPGPSWKTPEPRTKAPATGSRQKVFKTTDKHVLVGVVRDAVPGDISEIVDVLDAFSQMKVSSYQRGAGDEWEQIENLGTKHSAPVSHVKSLQRLESDASKLLGRVEASIQQARAYAKTSKIPVEIEEILEFKGQSLDEVADNIEKLLVTPASGAEPLPRSRQSAAQGLIAELQLNAVRLRAEGKRLRVGLIKSLPPTAAHIEYLKAQDEIDITRTGKRRPISKSLHKDYLQEYEIRTRDDSVRWYAHFHYATTDAAPKAFTAAHLKTAEQRTFSTQALYEQAQSSKDVIEIYRSKISPALAEALFLSIT